MALKVKSHVFFLYVGFSSFDPIKTSSIHLLIHIYSINSITSTFTETSINQNSYRRRENQIRSWRSCYLTTNYAKVAINTSLLLDISFFLLFRSFSNILKHKPQIIITKWKFSSINLRIFLFWCLNIIIKLKHQMLILNVLVWHWHYPTQV